MTRNILDIAGVARDILREAVQNDEDYVIRGMIYLKTVFDNAGKNQFAIVWGCCKVRSGQPQFFFEEEKARIDSFFEFELYCIFNHTIWLKGKIFSL